MEGDKPAQHTAGPWALQGSFIVGNLLKDGTSQPIGSVFGLRFKDTNQEESKANGHLMVASLAMLDVCLGMRDLIDRCGLKVSPEFDAALNDALAQAEGRA